MYVVKIVKNSMPDPPRPSSPWIWVRSRGPMSARVEGPLTRTRGFGHRTTASAECGIAETSSKHTMRHSNIHIAIHINDLDLEMGVNRHAEAYGCLPLMLRGWMNTASSLARSCPGAGLWAIYLGRSSSSVSFVVLLSNY